MKRKNVIVIATLTTLALFMAILLRGSTQTIQNWVAKFSSVQTAAVSTFASNLTQTAAARPTITPTLTPTITPPLPSATPTPSCYGLRFIKDVTIKDFTQMNPGETFTKTWLVLNDGTCAWKPGFRFAFYGGDPMGGANYTLPHPVSPGGEISLSISMTAPSGTGIIIGTWRMSDMTGWFFGDALTVKIDLSGETPTP
jgi:hypothetical protein